MNKLAGEPVGRKIVFVWRQGKGETAFCPLRGINTDSWTPFGWKDWIVRIALLNWKRESPAFPVWKM
jgi:hypothetical protein